jgi:Ca-activated chloride channel family protein
MKHTKRTRSRVTLVAFSLVLVVIAGHPFGILGQDARPTFKASVAVVPISAVVRDSRNRIVRDLTRNDFQVFENGQSRTIVNFRSTDRASLSVGLLVDTSGSMRGPNMDNGLETVQHVMHAIDVRTDEVALFTFDKALRQETPFTNDRERILCLLDGIDAWGLTSLYDAIAETAKRLEERKTQRRAVVVVTDGLDTSSALTPADVSGLASAIDVPVYVVAVVPPRHPDTRGEGPTPDDDLANLAYWTGGDVRHVTEGEAVATVIAALMTELRQQYFIAIESASTPGWYRLEVTTKRKNLTVRARSGYFGAS